MISYKLPLAWASGKLEVGRQALAEYKNLNSFLSASAKAIRMIDYFFLNSAKAALLAPTNPLAEASGNLHRYNLFFTYS